MIDAMSDVQISQLEYLRDRIVRIYPDARVSASYTIGKTYEAVKNDSEILKDQIEFLHKLTIPSKIYLDATRPIQTEVVLCVYEPKNIFEHFYDKEKDIFFLLKLLNISFDLHTPTRNPKGKMIPRFLKTGRVNISPTSREYSVRKPVDMYQYLELHDLMQEDRWKLAIPWPKAPLNGGEPELDFEAPR